MFGAVVSLPRAPSEARLVAEALEALARALRDWPLETWQQIEQRPVTPEAAPPLSRLLDRLVVQAAPLAVHAHGRDEAIRSAEVTAAVLRALWPAQSQPPALALFRAALP
jgi:hypothetical protein